jgi:ATP-dependent DNA ligase
MSIASELRRRVRAEQSLPRYEPCLPRPAKLPPAGPGWIHEIKHDGFRIIAHRTGDRVQLVTRAGNSFASRFPLIAAAITALPVRSCVIDGEAIACDENGLSVFDLLHYQRRDQIVTLCAFDLIELDGEDLRPMPIERRKSTLLRPFATGIPASCSMRTTSLTVPSSSKTPARLAAKASCRNGLARRIAPAAVRIGSRSKIRRRRP